MHDAVGVGLSGKKSLTYGVGVGVLWSSLVLWILAKKIKGKIKNKKVTAVRGIKKAVFSKKYFKKVQNHASQPPKIAVDLLIFFYLYPIRKSHPFKILCWVVTPWYNKKKE